MTIFRVAVIYTEVSIIEVLTDDAERARVEAERLGLHRDPFGKSLCRIAQALVLAHQDKEVKAE